MTRVDACFVGVLCAVALLSARPATAWTHPGQVRVVAEARGGILAPPQAPSALMGGAGLTVEVGVARLAQIRALGTLEWMRDQPLPWLSMAGLTVAYGLDALAVTPVVELGLAYALGRRGPLQRWPIPLIGFGIDGVLARRLVLGVNVRYAPLYGTSLLQNPGYFSVGLRCGVIAALP